MSDNDRTTVEAETRPQAIDEARRLHAQLQAQLSPEIWKLVYRYGEAMRQLSSTGPDVVAAAITRRSNEPEFQAMAGSIKADEAGLRQRGTLVSVDDLKARCPAGTQTN